MFFPRGLSLELSLCRIIFNEIFNAFFAESNGNCSFVALVYAALQNIPVFLFKADRNHLQIEKIKKRARPSF